jgi:hypothetical protein
MLCLILKSWTTLELTMKRISDQVII